MHTGPSRRAGRGMREALLRPRGALLMLWIASRVLPWPRRVPDLRKLAGSTGFSQVQAAVAGWLSTRLAQLEADAPWLDRAGCQVRDWCETSLASGPLTFPPDPPSVMCRREVTVVYGADGNLPGRLTELLAAAGRAGWVYEGVPDPGQQHRGESPLWPFGWPAAGEENARPPGLETTLPPAWLDSPSNWLAMGIGWISRGQPGALTATGETAPAGDTGAATAVRQPVELSGTGIDRLAGLALARHQHAIAVQLKAIYYGNFNPGERPGRLPKRLLPVW